MKKTGLFILVITLTLVFSGCSLPGKQLLEKKSQALQQFDEIKELIDKEEFDAAFEKCKPLIKSRYISENSWNEVVVLFQDQSRFEEGLYILNTLLLKNAKNDSTLNNLSWAYHMINENESANLFADKALAILPNSAYELSNKANALLGLEEYDEAIQYYDLALKMSPDFSSAVWGKAISYSDMEDYEKSLEFFLKYREIMPEDEESTRYYITSCYNNLNQPMNAIREYENFYNQDTTDTSPLYSIAYIYYDQKDYTRALEYYDKILGVDPEDVWAMYYKVDCYARMDRMDEAIQALKTVIELDPEMMYEIYYLDEAEKIRNHPDFKSLFQ
ncbi:MAG: tetratricopeptide repeat protein [Ruminiclostridium sp.]|nr:tetratricopeptide repeat protein [Ruminiclostridium sp.]